MQESELLALGVRAARQPKGGDMRPNASQREMGGPRSIGVWASQQGHIL